VVATVSVGTRPYFVAYDSSKGEVFVTNQEDNTVSVISNPSPPGLPWIYLGTAAAVVVVIIGAAVYYMVIRRRPKPSAAPPP